MDYQTITCANGLRIIYQPKKTDVIYCGLAVKAGTRHEAQGEEGLAHFCEHLSFKGTKRRTAVEIFNAIEGVGGELNAFTNKEDTVFYAATTRLQFCHTADVLRDIVFCSQYPQHEVEKERLVVCDEIESYEDSPAELIFDDFENLLFEGHALGHNILGTAEKVKQYTSADAFRFTSRYYRPDNCIFFVSGTVNLKPLIKMLENVPAAPTDNTAPTPAEQTDNRPTQKGMNYGYKSIPSCNYHRVVRHRNTHQAHVVMGGLGYADNDPNRWALFLLINMLGGPAMNSRLNLVLRERNGLVYTVEGNTTTYSDTGVWTVYFGCDTHEAMHCYSLVRRELNHLMEAPLTEQQLESAKQQMNGQLTIAADNREQFALDFAKNFLHRGTERNINDIIAHVDALSAEQLQQVAREAFDPDRTLTLIYD